MSATTPPHLAIIGGGVAGLSAAKAARAVDETARVTLISAEPAAPYYKPDLSKGFLTQGRSRPEPELASDQYLADAGFEWVSGWEVEEVDLRDFRLRGGGKAIAFDRLLFATGAASVDLPIPGASLAGVVKLRSLDDAQRFQAKLALAHNIVVVGGGLIGLEVAASARALGKGVVVLEQAPRVMARTFPAAIADAVADYHTQSGVRIFTDVRVEAFVGADSLSSISTSQGNFSADLALVAAGGRPDYRLALEAGIACDDGILVDCMCQTSEAHVFAAGDVARIIDGNVRGRFESWRHAEEQGRIAGVNLAGGRKIYDPAPWFWSDQGELHLQGCGTANADAEEVVRIGSDGLSRIAFQIWAGRLVAAFGVSFRRGMGGDFACLSRLVGARPAVTADELADADLPLKGVLRRVRESASWRP